MVELADNRIAVWLGEVCHALALRDVLADSAVGVLVGASLPGMVGSREVDHSLGGHLEPGMAVEFRPIVTRDRVPRMRLWRISGMARRFTAAVVRARNLPSTR